MSIYDKSSLVLIPSGTKTGKVFSQKPVSGDGDFTFTRASAATRVNADGNIEKETQNLLLQSNTFDTTWINNLGGAVTGGQAGYDGTNNAWEINKNTTSFRRIEQSGLSLSGIWTFSVYAKAGTRDVIILRNFVGGDSADFNLTSGTITNQGGGTIIARSMTDVGNGWYRCSITCNSTSTQIQIYIDWNQTIGGNILIQDAQVNQGLIAQEVITTTTAAVYGGITDNTPRLDYTDSSCPALLLEPLRTNLIAYSEYFNGADWINVGVTATENAVISPEGVQNATQLNFTGTSYKRFEQNTSNAATACTTSIFMKYINHDIVMARMDSTSGASYAWFNIQTGEVLKVDGANGSVPDPIASVDDYGDGWYRLNTTQNSMASNQEIFWYFVPDINTSTGGWTGSGSAYAYGAQFEEGSYATSYIPTYGSSVSRVFDECIDAGDNQVIESTQGTIYGEQKSLETDFTYNYFVAVSDGTNNNRLEIRQSGTGLQFLWRVGGTYQNSIILSSAPFSSTIKYAFRYSSTDIKFYVNGSLVGTINSPTLYPSGTLNNFQFADGSGGTNFRGVVNQALYFPTALTDQELIDLTTL